MNRLNSIAGQARLLAKRLVRRILSATRISTLLRLVHIPAALVLIKWTRIFDAEWYRLQYSDIRTEKYKNKYPLIHYLLIGRKKGLSPSPFFVGEYFDPEHCYDSILDPLVRYLLRRSTWNRATSVYFDGKTYTKHTRFLPPLAIYIRELNVGGDNRVYADSQLGDYIDLQWNKLRPSLYKAIKMRTEQVVERSKADPVRGFNFEREKEVIDDYRIDTFGRLPDLVSIVMPAWNRQGLIGHAIRSVQNQSHGNWELLIVDDGSTDETAAVVNSHAKSDARIKLLKSSHGGVCKARNIGIEKAKGEWVAFLDSDNVWTEDFLQVSLAMLRERSAKASYSAIEMRNKRGVLYRATEPNNELIRSGNYIDLNALIVNKALLKKVGHFDERLRRMVDYDLIYRLSKVVSFIYIPIVGVHYTNHDKQIRISTTESTSWDGVVKNKNGIDWKKRQPSAKISIIVPVKGYAYLSAQSVAAQWQTIHHRNDVEIIIVDASSNSATNITMAQLQYLDKRISYYREVACRDAVLAANYGFAKSSGDIAVVVSSYIWPELGWLDELTNNLEDNEIRAPIQLKPGRTIMSAGAEYWGDEALPVSLFRDHPLSDIKKLNNIYEVDGVMGGVFAMRANTFVRLRGLNPLYDKGFESHDMSHRAKLLGIRTTIARDATVLNVNQEGESPLIAKGQYILDWKQAIKSSQSPRWKDAGLRVVDYRQTLAGPDQTTLVSPIVEAVKARGVYRWAIKIAAPSDDRRFLWGDLYYAQALSAALERLGQTVAIDYHDYHRRRTDYLDDIVITLRGLDYVHPQPEKVNILWVISHPDLVTIKELDGYDLTYAAGQRWVDMVSIKTAKPVQYMPQCTDSNIFKADTKQNKEFAKKILFVGNSRKQYRPIVHDAIKAGLDISVYGDGWRGIINDNYIKGSFIPNHELAAAYGAASAVLNDHWDDMKRWGFISNRIFDALAAGGFVISDYVEGMGQTVGVKALTAYKDIDELKKAIVAAERSTKQDKLTSSEYVRKHHSFDSRAKALLADVNELLKLK